MSVEVATERDISSNLAPLSDIANIVGGYAFKGKDFGDCGVSVVKIANIEPPRVNIQNCDKISSDKLVGLDRFRVSKGDILMAMTGATVGKVGRVRDSQLAYLNQRVARISSKISPEHNDFIFALLSQKGFEEKILNNSSGSAQANISTDGIGSVLVAQMDLNSQLQIGRFIASLDDKIELNRQINQTLEAMAQAIFKSWFVDFDPVKAKIAAIEAGQDPLRAAMSIISGKSDAELDVIPRPQYDELAATASLFPEDLVESELGDVPKGWEVKAISEICDLNSSSWNSKTLPGSVRYVDLASTKNGEIVDIQTVVGTDIPSRARRILKVNDTIFGTVRPANRSFAFVGEANLTGSTGFAVLRPRADHLREYLYLAVTTDENIERLAHLADGGAYPAVKPELLIASLLATPNDNLILAFHKITSVMFVKIIENRHMSLNLAQLRDTLLPKLLSGELSVSSPSGLTESMAGI